MNITVTSPSKAVITDFTQDDIRQLQEDLTYTNTANAHLLKRIARNHYWKNNNPTTWAEEYKRVKATIKKTLLYQEDNQIFIRPGSLAYLGLSHENKVRYSNPKKIPWSKPLPFELHPYQEESWQKLLEVKHGNVELCTGAGKSAILLKICRESGLRTAIIAPSQSIFQELVEKFEYHLGAGKVGKFGDGKKQLGKLFTICIGDSIANIEPGTKEWEFFSTMDMFCADESHTWGADSLEQICHGVLSEVPYRFFFSGTQTRGDGAEKLLQSIIGKTVCTLTTAEAVRQGYICPHEFKIVEIESSNPNGQVSDPLAMKRIHFLKNKNIARFIAKLANADATVNKRQTLVLVDELDQIAMLAPLLTVPYVYAHSEKRAARLAELGLTNVDKKESVEKFNMAEAMVIIGTSCISTGTNMFPTHNCVNWQGGSSEIKTKQGAVGRSVRFLHSSPWANKCVQKPKAIIWDFDVRDIEVMERHLDDRIGYYAESGTDIKRISLNAKAKKAGGF